MAVFERSVVTLMYSLRTTAGSAERSCARVRVACCGGAVSALWVLVGVGVAVLLMEVSFVDGVRAVLLRRGASGGGELRGARGEVEQAVLERAGRLGELED